MHDEPGLGALYVEGVLVTEGAPGLDLISARPGRKRAGGWEAVQRAGAIHDLFFPV